ncbi:DUF4403 family protein [Deinococcus sp. Marseille-Q6407]|uniref:DUF4403 family protein n=1 Tax=Deinococcus sp. Marseille-Q6407 TaxID=2969223 RepID=UPI0021C09944|nr:DUF4403 family protein [Deinococcus sp. Marseille-Q6407]
MTSSDAAPPNAVPENALPPAPLPLSSLSLPVTVPLAGVREALNARIPREFARIDREQRVLGGRAGIRIYGVVARQGDIQVVPASEGGSGDALELEVPLQATFSVRPELPGSGAGWADRLSSSLTRDLSGAATVRLRLRPYLRSDWEAGAEVSGELRWTEPLSAELLPGTRLSVAALAESAVRSQLTRVTQEVAHAVSEAAGLRERAETVWTQLQQPWPLPLPAGNAEVDALGPAYAQAMPQTLGVAGLGLRGDALQLTLQAEGYLRAELGQPPRAPAGRALLPELRVTAQAGGPGELHLRAPVLLPFVALARLVTAAAQRELAELPLPGWAPRLQLEGLDVAGSPQEQRLDLTARLTLSGLGRPRRITAWVGGRPWLRPGGRVVTLENVQVQLDAELPGQRWLAPFLSERLSAALARIARFDLAPQLTALEQSAAAGLPATLRPGLSLRAEPGGFQLDDLRVTRQGLEITAAADAAALNLQVDAAALIDQLG